MPTVVGPAGHCVRRLAAKWLSRLNDRPGAGALRTDAYALTSRRLPVSFHGFRIVQLTDLHGRSFGARQETLLAHVDSLHPDLVVLTGDCMAERYEGRERRAVQELFYGLTRRFPVYAVLGNHESRSGQLETVLEDYRSAKVRLLRNRGVYLWRGGVCIGLAGMETVDSASEAAPRLRLKQENRAIRNAVSRYEREGRPAFQILLAHKPELLPLYADYPVDLVLSGHAHGGLMEIPFSGGRCLLAPGQGLFPRYTHGIYREGDTLMVLGRGLGGPRIGIGPEVVCIDLFSENKVAENVEIRYNKDKRDRQRGERNETLGRTVPENGESEDGGF